MLTSTLKKKEEEIKRKEEEIKNARYSTTKYTQLNILWTSSIYRLPLKILKKE